MNNQTKTDQPFNNHELASITWDEYKYRHELCWNLIFKITLITTTLSIIPYLNNNIIEKAEPIVFFTPLIGIAVAIFGRIRLLKEINLLDIIRDAHREIQIARFKKEIHFDNPTTFTAHVKMYMNALILLTIINFIIMLFILLDIKNLYT